MPDATRVLHITKGALKSSRRTRKQKGGYDTAPGDQLLSTRISTMPALMKGGFSPSSVASPSSSVASPSQPSPILTGGTRKALHLVPKKEVLNLVKGSGSASASASTSFASSASASKGVPHTDKEKRNKTRKVIRIQMGNMRKSLHRAKEIVESSKDKPIAEILEILLKAEIIKKKQTETPMSDMKEKLIRGIYRDYLQLRYNAL